MSDPVDAATWRGLLDAEAPLPRGELAALLADAQAGPDTEDDALKAVFAALDAEEAPLVDDDPGGAGGVRLADSGGEPDPGDGAGAGGEREDSPDAEGEADADRSAAAAGGPDGWGGAEWADPEAGVFPDRWADRERWMCHTPGDKMPFAPWGDPDHPAGDPDRDARYKWGLADNHADLDTAREWADKLDQAPEAGPYPRLAGVTFLLGDDGAEPDAFVDGDDVRDPETGEVHPAFVAILEHLGPTYADVSVSGSGIHAPYRDSDLPEGVAQVKFPLDTEPWGANDEPPSVEIYDHAKVCVSTGQHVPGTAADLRPWDDDALRAILDAAGEYDPADADAPASAFEAFDAEEYDPTATTADETTDDIRDLFAAIDRLDARRVAEKTIVREWQDRRGTEQRAFVPTWAPADYDGTANYCDPDKWVDTGTRDGLGDPVCMAAIHASDIPVDDRDCPDAVCGETWFDAVDHLRGLGFDVPELSTEADPRDQTVTLDPAEAWDAAGRVRPGDLDADADRAVGLDAVPGGWRCPGCGDTVDVVRAVAITTGAVPSCGAPLDDEAYTRAYQAARERFGAPLPEYVSREVRTDRWALVKGALRQLDFFDLDREALRSTVTVEDPDGDAALRLNPAYRDSDSGESVIVYPDGTVYDAHPDHAATVFPRKFVALDSGAITWEEYLADGDAVTGDTYVHVYETMRLYGAPLPEWHGNADPFHTPVLPTADDLGDPADVDRDRALAEAREAVAGAYADAADEDGAALLSVLPALGKTEQVFRQAADRPALYVTGRRELMKEAVERRAPANDVEARLLPVFSEHHPRPEDKEAAAAAVREEGQAILKDREALRAAVAERVGEPPAAPEDLPGAEEDDDTVALDRASCPTADGEHGLGWWLAAHAARQRGYKPRHIHDQAVALFGEPLPCTCRDGDDEGGQRCEYGRGWDRVTDPEAPADVLVGHYGHAHVASARTYREADEFGEREQPRVVALDEFPGGAFDTTLGDEYLDAAAWLARALGYEVPDRQALGDRRADLWDDDTIRAWLDEEDTPEPYADLAAALRGLVGVVEAVDTARRLREYHPDELRVLDVYDLVDEVAALGDRVPHPDKAAALARDLEEELRPGRDAPGIVEYHGEAGAGEDDGAEESRDPEADPAVRGDVFELARDLAGAAGAGFGVEEVREEVTLCGALADLVDDALAAFRDPDADAGRVLDAAATALRGGREGCETLAIYADDGAAHPLADALLYALLAPSGEGEPATDLDLSVGAFGEREDDTTRATHARRGKDRVLLDRNHRGAVVRRPPAFGDATPVGLDATGRPELWRQVLGEEVERHDIHDTPAERRRFLRDVFGLRVVATDRRNANFYEGDPSGKSFDDDVEVVREAADAYGELAGGDPAVVTTKTVEGVLADRLDGVAAGTAHYGDLKGSERLAEHRLAVLLGCQHYGDGFVDRWAGLAGQQVTRTGRGAALDYGCPVGNAALDHMSKDQVLQAALRFGRDTEGAVVVAHTAQLRDDVPVVAEGEVVDTYSRSAQQVAAAAAELRHRRGFTAADVRDRLPDDGPSPRTVRRVLAELASAGYLDREGTDFGKANRYTATGDLPGAAEVDLPELDAEAGQLGTNVFYTWSVRVSPDDPPGSRGSPGLDAVLPAPDRAAAGAADTGPPD